ncbi:MAG: hypothetical protein PF569_05235 [Candidatus Woesearchaeota archaeon]|jgi:hypothetical protein|nr:hypothetical protein [Candidatus Woesearchaeota archaeon]
MFKPNPNILYSLTQDNSIALVNKLYISLVNGNDDFSLRTIRVARNYGLETSLDIVKKDILVNFYSELLNLNAELRKEKLSNENLKGLRRILAYTIHTDN